MASHRRRVVVTGIGAVCGAGRTADEVFAAACEGRSAMRRIRRFDARDFPVDIAAEGPWDGDPATGLYREWGQLAASAAVVDAFPEGNVPAAPVVVGSAVGSLGLTEASGAGAGSPLPWSTPTLAHEIAVRTGLGGPSLMINSSFASGADAIGIGARRIREGDAEIVLAGGSEAPITPLMIAGFTALGALADGGDDPATAVRPFDGQRRGAGFGEGAGFVVLEEREHAIARGARIYAEVLGYGPGMDAFHLTQLPEDGNGLRAAMTGALIDAGLAPDAVVYLNAHGTGTGMNDRIETAVIHDVFGEHASRLAVSSTKAVTGHLLGAAGALEAVITILAVESGIAPPTINWSTRDPSCDLDYVPDGPRRMPIGAAMTNSMGFGGHAASLVFGRQ